MTEIATPRLHLLALSLAQLRMCLDDLPALEAELGLRIARAILTARVRRAIGMKIDKMGAADESLHNWYTYWLVVVGAEQVGAGLAGFKSVPNERGAVEIGYGIAPSHQNRGYTSEAVKALFDWAFQHPSCKTVTASEVQNPASRRVLEKLGARLVAEDKRSTSWEITR